MQDIDKLSEELAAAVAAAEDLEALEEVRIRALGRKGHVTALMKGLGAMTADERKTAGPALNALKDRIGSAIEARREALKDLELEARLAGESLDLSLPLPAFLFLLYCSLIQRLIIE